jgi:hypothetical protein
MGAQISGATKLKLCEAIQRDCIFQPACVQNSYFFFSEIVHIGTHPAL